jgi:hypothetical protein
MTFDATGSAPPLLAAVAQLGAVLDQAADAAVWSLSDPQVLTALQDTERLAARLAGLQCRLIAEADARGAATEQGAASTAAWLRHRLRLDPRDAAARVRLAGDPQLQGTREALADGTVSAGQARVIGGVVRQLPPEDRARGERFLIGQAGLFDPVRLAQLGRHLRHVADPDAADRAEQDTAHRREFSIVDLGDGGHALRGMLDAEGAALLRAALDPLAAPAPAADGTPDRRPGSVRYGEALVELARRALDAGDRLPGSRGARPHLTITAGLEVLRGVPGAPAAESTGGQPLSAETLRRLACDAAITTVLVDGLGVPLDVGREQRTVTPGLWAALVIRDRGCVFAGCTRPVEWCEAHHVLPWSQGGPTALSNLALLCGRHHRVVHHDGWSIRFGDDRHPELIPPPWVDPDRTSQRNPYWRIRDHLPPPGGP